MEGKFKAVEVMTESGGRGTLYFSHFGENRALNLTEDEKELANRSIELLVRSGVNGEYLGIERKGDSYATIVVTGGRPMDLMRFRYGPRAKWVAVPMTREDAKSNINNPLFAAQKNKKQLMWKANIDSTSDVDQFIPFVVNRIRFVQSANPGEMDDVLTL